jgi:ATP-binding cassette subfamily B multidrug efflux pump
MTVLSNPKPNFLPNDWGLLLKLGPYLRRHQRIFWVAMVLLVPIALAGAIQPLIVGQAISLLRGEKTWGILEGKSLTDGINLLIIFLLCSLGVRLTFLSLQGYLVQRIGQEITAGIREDLFTHVTSLATKFFDRTPVGKLVTRLTSDVEALGDVFASGAIGIFSDLIYMLVIIITIFSLEWRLAGLLVLLLIPVMGLIIFFQKQYRKANYRAREELSHLNSMLQENVVGINIVQLFGREEYNAKRFGEINDRYRRQIDKTIISDAAVSAILEWISLIAIGAVLCLGGWLVLGDNLSIGLLSAFILYAQRFFEPLRQFADKFTMFQSGFTAIERITELMNEPIEIQDVASHELKHLPPIESPLHKVGEIRFDHVWFGYKPSEYVLKDLNFTIYPGEKVALVGPTGAGKSSIIRLLCRLYEPTQGNIYLDGIDIRELPQAQLRRYIGVILQESFIFAGDVQSNIALGEEFTPEEIIEAAQLTNIEPFIEQLPQGYQTELRERGANLSGGQKQLLAFARVAIRNPRVLVLDEATSSLDVGTERQIQQALDKLLIHRTAIIIAHRLSTIRSVDKILVLKRGEIIESGNHQTLLNQGGLYASLYRLQEVTESFRP